jgi:hypothetical protein
MMRRTLIGLLIFVATGCTTVPTSFTPSNPIPPNQFSHLLWQESLRAHVHEGLVDYPAIHRQGQLASYLALLDRVDPNQLSVVDRLAFWINAYNAFAVKGILDHYSPTTLFGRYRYFIAHEHRIGGQTINLYNLEREILVAQFQDPRMHFAIVCASASCPKLQSWAYEGLHLDQQLNRVTSEFINDPSRNRFDRSKKVAYLSMIFKWFEKDFITHSGSVIEFVRHYVRNAALQQELQAQQYEVEFLDYDWILNGPPP